MCLSLVPVGSQPATVIPRRTGKQDFPNESGKKIADCRQGDAWNVLSTTSKQHPFSRVVTGLGREEERLFPINE